MKGKDAYIGKNDERISSVLIDGAGKKICCTLMFQCKGCFSIVNLRELMNGRVYITKMLGKNFMWQSNV